MWKVNPYKHNKEVHNLKSPDIVVPVLVDFFKPTSVLDVGCGIGTWLHSFRKNGVKNIFGVDGDFVDRELLKEHIKENEFAGIDLKDAFNLKRKFDLVVCLEVAEHLPPESAETFIHSLCQHGDLIVFSAAIPGQGGQNHLNEQWVDYWAEIFRKNGYSLYDMLRPVFWNDSRIDYWYKQNMVVFSKKPLWVHVPTTTIHRLVHPDLFKQNMEYNWSLLQRINELEGKKEENIPEGNP